MTQSELKRTVYWPVDVHVTPIDGQSSHDFRHAEPVKHLHDVLEGTCNFELSDVAKGDAELPDRLLGVGALEAGAIEAGLPKLSARSSGTSKKRCCVGCSDFYVDMSNLWKTYMRLYPCPTPSPSI